MVRSLTKASVVIKPNNLINAHYSLTLNGARLEFLILAKLSPSSFLVGLGDVVITNKEWSDVFGLFDNPYSDMKRALESMSGVVVRFQSGKECWFFSKYEQSRGEVRVELDSDFMLACLL